MSQLRRDAAPVAALAAVLACLAFLYWRQSAAQPVNADGASNVLQAHDMLHGNLLLRGWRLSDVSFYLTELPLYLLIETVLGLRPQAVHVAAAITYTLLVLLTALLAKGHARGEQGVARAAVGALIIVAPQLSATSTVLLGPDHTGSAVPLLVAWLIIDRARPGWHVPVLAGLIMTAAVASDRLALITGVAPLILACGLRAWRAPGRRRPELVLAAAAAAAAALGLAVPAFIGAAGGFRQAAPGTSLVSPGELPESAWVTVRAFLELFGANVFSASPAAELAFTVLHLAGVIAVCWASARAFAQFFSAEPVVPVFAVAVVLNLTAYLVSRYGLTIAATREIAAVMPFGAVLAGRLLAAPLLASRARLAAPVLAAGYLAGLGYGAFRYPVTPAVGQQLAAWLTADHHNDGLAPYWQANSTTVASAGRVLVSSVWVREAGGKAVLVRGNWEVRLTDYNPARHYADFVVAKTADAGTLTAAVSTFGPPAARYQAAGFTVLVWHENLLTRLGAPG